jgi:hypothetical protein
MNIFEVVAKIDKLLKNGELKESDKHEECDIVMFRLIRDGMHYGKNKKHDSRVMICLPPVVCGEDINEYEDWVFYSFAIKKSVWGKIITSEQNTDEQKLSKYDSVDRWIAKDENSRYKDYFIKVQDSDNKTNMVTFSWFDGKDKVCTVPPKYEVIDSWFLNYSLGVMFQECTKFEDK